MGFSLASTLTNEERMSIYKGELLEKVDANKIIDDWIKNDNLLSYDNLIKKLEIENITLEEFATIISKSNVDNKEISSAKWNETYKDIIRQYSNSKNFNFYNEESIMYVLNPMIYWCKVQLEQEICKYNNIKIHYSVIEVILHNIANNLFNVCSKTIVYEYYNQEEKSFKSYNINNFKNVEDLEKFFEKYPVIAKRLVVKTTYLLKTYLDSLYQIDRDYKDIESTMDIKIGNTVTNLKGNLGDTHEKGKFVIQYEFDNTNKLIYKPKELIMAKSFYEIISWINRKSDCEKLKIPKNYYNPEYTIEEYIESKACRDDQEVKRYYKRLGQLLGITYLLNGNDFHHENIIANGEFPYLIDLETLFIQPIPFNEKDIFDYNSLKIQGSIDGMMFLPSNKTFADKNGKGVDLSALSYKKQKLPYKVLSLIGDVDNPKFEYVDHEIETENNIPILYGRKMSYENYRSYIEQGFKDVSKFIINNKFEFLKQLNVFKNLKARQLMRGTNEYATILEYASHPKYTMNMVNLEKMFYSMWEYKVNDKRFITSEIEDLLEDDIPLFRTITTDKDLIDSKGRIIRNYFNKSAFDRVKEKVIKFDENELNKQLDYINISFNNAKDVTNKKLRIKNNLYKFNKVLLKNDDYVNLDIILKDINKIIEDFSIRYKDQCIWENLVNDEVKLDLGFRKGLLGIYHYLYMNNDSDIDLENIRNVFSNEKILGLAILNNKMEDLLNLLNIIECNFDNNYNKDILKLNENIIKIFNEKAADNKLNLSDTIKAIKVIGNLYKLNKSYEFKKTISKLKDNLETQLLKEGLTNLKYSNNISIIDLLECVTLLNSIYPNKQFNFNLDYINELNNEYFEEIYTIESLEKYSNEEYRNIIRSLNLNINNSYIDIDKVKQGIVKIVNEKEIDENIIYIIDILINCYIKSEDQEIKNILDEKIKSLIEYYTITNNFPISEINYFKNLSIENGISGIGYEILRYKNNDIPSLINTI